MGDEKVTHAQHVTLRIIWHNFLRAIWHNRPTVPTMLTLKPPTNSRRQLLGIMDTTKAQKRAKRLRDPVKEPF